MALILDFVPSTPRTMAEWRRPAANALWHDAEVWGEEDIAPRPWLVPGYLLRGSVTVLSGPGGVSKSTLAATWAVALATGEPFGSFVPVERGRVVMLNCEDDQNEQRRRLSAVLKTGGKAPADLGKRIARMGCVSAGRLIELNEKTGEVTRTQALQQIEQRITADRADLLIVDPFVETHNANENDNVALRAVVAELRSLAADQGIAVLLVHHARKGAGASPGDMDTMRGASAIAGAARVVLTATPMQANEAAQYNVEARDYFRLDGAKANYSRNTGCEWFERVSVHLDNGDSVGVVKPWHPPEQAAPSAETLEAILAGVAAGSAEGPWSPKMGSFARSIRNLFKNNGIGGARQQTALLHDLISTHGCTIASFRDGRRKLADGIRTADGSPAAANWIDAADEESFPAPN
jgi:hypothetical protein